MSAAARRRLLGFAVAALMLALDQGTKLWLLYPFNLAAREPVALGPFVELVLAWNPGISYSLFPASSERAKWTLLGLTLLATLALAAWLWTARSRTLSLALGLLVGGALGNAWDRFAYGAVADFIRLHAGDFSWYIFNLADCGIVAGVALLLYDSVFGRDPAAA